jgi:hypothetical protein
MRQAMNEADRGNAAVARLLGEARGWPPPPTAGEQERTRQVIAQRQSPADPDSSADSRT